MINAITIETALEAVGVLIANNAIECAILARRRELWNEDAEILLVRVAVYFIRVGSTYLMCLVS